MLIAFLQCRALSTDTVCYLFRLPAGSARLSGAADVLQLRAVQGRGRSEAGTRHGALAHRRHGHTVPLPVLREPAAAKHLRSRTRSDKKSFFLFLNCKNASLYY